MSFWEQMGVKTTKVVKGIKGQTILVHGMNNTGKTAQGCSAPKPFYLPFEFGAKSIEGIPYKPIHSWADFKLINAMITNPFTLDQWKENVETVIFDTVIASAEMCKKYICEKFNAPSIRDGRDGFGLWDEYRAEYWNEINKLTNAGYTVYFISHTVEVDCPFTEGKWFYPEGDKRSMQPIVDLCDIVLFLQPVYTDDPTKPSSSIAHSVASSRFFARCRNEYMPTKIPFTFENVDKAYTEAVEKKQQLGAQTISTDELLKEQKNEELDYKKVIKTIEKQYMKLKEQNRLSEYDTAVGNYFPDKQPVSTVPPDKIELLNLLSNELDTILKRA